MPLATPRVGVVRVGDVDKTTPPVPVDADVEPVPPLAVGSAVPEYVIASVPEEVIGDPDIERNDGTDAATEVTVPVPGDAGVAQESDVPLDVRTCPFVPTVVRPVPPDVVGIAVPEYETVNPPFEFSVTGEPDTERNAGTFIEIVLLPRVVMSAPAAKAKPFAVVANARAEFAVVCAAAAAVPAAPAAAKAVFAVANASEIVVARTVLSERVPRVTVNSAALTEVIYGVDHESVVPLDVRT